VRPLRFAPPVRYVYNPLVYARATYDQYVDRYGQGSREVVLVGMNPGPWGMAQTGIPFGEVSAVRDWLALDAPVDKPPAEHPKRPVLGLACPRHEVSGQRLWGWARDNYETPERFFERFFVINYCPLAFLEDSGRNRTPDKLPADERDALLEACDRALQRTVRYFSPRYVIGVGAFAERRIRAVCDDASVTVGRMPHPSPASPQANRGWSSAASAALAALGVQ
jgi:single-strand selective monofunctional uracil DNA glycosylase